MIKSFSSLFTPRNVCCGYLLESPRWGDSNKSPQRMFLGVLNTIFLNISYYLPHLKLRNRSIQIVVLTNFVVISNVDIKRLECIYSKKMPTFSRRGKFTRSLWLKSNDLILNKMDALDRFCRHLYREDNCCDFFFLSFFFFFFFFSHFLCNEPRRPKSCSKR